jgi:hypothetical protein
MTRSTEIETLGLGLHFEDLPVGRTFRTIGRTITEADLIGFVNATGMTESRRTILLAPILHGVVGWSWVVRGVLFWGVRDLGRPAPSRVAPSASQADVQT